jgi:hypothetical protein
MSVTRHEFSSHTYRLRPHSALSKHPSYEMTGSGRSMCNRARTKSLDPANRCKHLALAFPFSIYRNTNATAVVLLPSFETIIPASTNTHSHTHQLPISSTFLALSVTTTRRGLSPAPMGPRRSASLPPRALRGMVSTAFVHAVVPLSPRRWTAPRVTVGWRKTLAWCWGGGGDFG